MFGTKLMHEEFGGTATTVRSTEFQSDVTEKVDRYSSWSGYITKGGNVPNWLYHKRRGEPISTFLEVDAVKFKYSSGNISYEYTRLYDTQQPQNDPNKSYNLTGYLTPVSFFNSNELLLDSTHAENQALTKFYAHAQEVENQFKGLQFFGELRESLEMIRHPAKTLRQGFTTYLDSVKRHGHIRDKKKRLRAVQDTWLEYSFGWKPLISDIDSAVTDFFDTHSKPNFRKIVGIGRTKDAGDLGTQTPNGIGPLGYRYDLHWKEEVTIKYYGILFSRGNGTANNHSYGFKPEEFLPTLWELTPYSFLVDYFTNIGDIISSWSYRTIAPAWADKVIVRSGSYYTDNGNAIPNQSLAEQYWRVVNKGNPGSAQSSRLKITRIPDIEPGLPSLELELPGMSSLKWANIAALATSSRSAMATLNHLDAARKGTLRETD